MSPSLREFLFPDVGQELATTRRVLERVGDEHLRWKPHPKSMALGDLAFHCVNLLRWQLGIVTTEELDIAGIGRQSPPESQEEILSTFDRLRDELLDKSQTLQDDDLMREWVLRSGERVISRLTKAAALRSFGVSHMIHHRGQLSVYLRLLDLPVPAIYGPSADEGTL